MFSTSKILSSFGAIAYVSFCIAANGNASSRTNLFSGSNPSSSQPDINRFCLAGHQLANPRYDGTGILDAPSQQGQARYSLSGRQLFNSGLELDAKTFSTLGQQDKTRYTFSGNQLAEEMVTLNLSGATSSTGSEYSTRNKQPEGNKTNAASSTAAGQNVTSTYCLRKDQIHDNTLCLGERSD